MGNQLLKNEIEELSNYRFISEHEQSNLPLSIRLDQLLDNDTLFTFIQDVTKHIGSPNVKVTASMFSKRYAFLTAIYLYSMTAFNKRFNTSLEKIYLQTNDEDKIWLPTFYFSDLTVELSGQDREEWRREGIQSFFSNVISPVISEITKVTKQSKLILWENIAIYIFWLYETVLAEHENEDVRKRAKEDLHFLVQEAPGSLFGKFHENPIKRHYHEKRYVEHLDEVVRVRTTCCFFYQITETSERCKICPQTCNRKK
ncbi:IucA/IucC family C-terminal-domain containing protein [Bacillus sp. 31A1R]|uniref:IucA/IucC family C-terminal-domain containing protein n=1 Tax=Robertmurraya mangrovi TaxID=3098077 RepID=A0ABU5IYC5_9BACI|nr:IucA/IucC family C-terminal-domain containing protein [Bacillus sp. 31A1R]MDZ5472168.1 IucA/IucC family C-terminal-domain containing protein [Bacillus sp. 31A1R]